MKLSYPQLLPHLSKTLAPLYWVSSDEVLLAEEAIDTIRMKARQSGFIERTIIAPESGSEWADELYAATHHLSLFATKKIVELRFHLSKFTAAHGKIIADYAASPVNDTPVILHTGKLDTKIEKSAWYKPIEKIAVILPLWPVSTEQLPGWIIERAKQRYQRTIEKSVAERIASLVEGNLLAAAQSLEKLFLLEKDIPLTEDLCDEVMTDHSHFDVFQLVDSVLLGRHTRSLHILQTLAAEEIEPTLILWALVREIRMLATLFAQQQKGIPLGQLFSSLRIWEKRQPGVRAFLKRHTVHTCWKKLLEAAKIDRIIKGADKGDTWQALELFIIQV